MHVKTRIRSAKANDHGSLASGCYEIGRIAEDLGDDSINNSFLVGFAKCLDSREFVYTCRMYATFKSTNHLWTLAIAMDFTSLVAIQFY